MNEPAPDPTRHQTNLAIDAALDDVASDAVILRGRKLEPFGVPVLPWDGTMDAPTAVDPEPRGAGFQPVSEIPTGKMPVPQCDSSHQPSAFTAGLALILLAAGSCGHGAAAPSARSRRAGGLPDPMPRRRGRRPQ